MLQTWAPSAKDEAGEFCQAGDTGEVQSFLEQKTGNLKRLKRLEQLMEKVEGKHQAKVKEVHQCGMNVARVQTMAAIKAACETADADETFGYCLDVEAVQTRRGERNRGGGARVPRLENDRSQETPPVDADWLRKKSFEWFYER